MRVHAVRCHAFTRVPVIVAEICAQSVDIQEQSHGAAQQFRKHFSASSAHGAGETRTRTRTNKTTTKMRSREIAVYDRAQSPSLSGCLRENKSVPSSIILAEVHKVGNPVVAVPLTHVEAELRGSFMLLPLRPRNKKRAARTPTWRRISAPTLSDPLRERRDARRRPPQL